MPQPARPGRHAVRARHKGSVSSRRRPRLVAGERLEARTMLSGNEPPVNHVPGPQTATSGVPMAFSAYLGNPFSISDPDAGENAVRVSLAVDSGSLSLVQPDPRGGLTYSLGDGVEDAAMVFTGTIAAINEALAWVSYRSAPGFTGAATVTITTNDLGMVGTGGPKSDTDTIAIDVSPPPAFAPSPSYETLPAVLDTSFNGTGKQVLALSDRTAGVDYVHDMLVLPDGKILAAGAIDDRFGVMRFNPDMTLDRSFGTSWQGYGLEVGGGTTVFDFGLGVHANSLAIDGEHRLLVAGGDKVVRLTTDGLIDPGFGVDGVSSGAAPIVAIRADGTILASGQANPLTIPGMVVNLISKEGVKLDSWAYDPLGFNYDHARGLFPIADGDTVIAGRASRQDHYFDYGFYTARISERGVLEAEWNAAFRPGSQPYYSPFINSILPLPDGRFLAVGIAYDDVAVSRHQATGELDLTFGENGLARVPVLTGTDTGYRATLAADGKILVAGYANNGVDNDVTVVRLTVDGRIDSSFGISGVVTANLGGDDMAYAIASLPDGKILVAGRSGNRIGLVRLLGDSDLSAAPQLPRLAPDQVRVLPGNMARELWVTWELPEPLEDGSVRDYVLEVSADGGETWHGMDDGVSLNRYASLRNLDPSLDYLVRVAAVNETGIGRWSWPSAAVRPAAAPFVSLVHVGSPGNDWDSDNLNPSQGDVLVEYRIGANEITVGQYVEFLNAVAKTDLYSLYNPEMATDVQVAGIARAGSDGDYTYTLLNDGGSNTARPISYVSWFDAARFANWLHNGRPIGPQGAATTETGAYALDGMVEGIPPAPSLAARYSIPTNDQWYKAAFYDPELESGAGGYWDYATQSDTRPGNLVGSLPNQANVTSGGISLNGTTVVGSFTGSPSHYGTFDQIGNVEEWTSWAVSGATSSQRAIRGGSWRYSVDPGHMLVKNWIGRQITSYEGPTVGFRLAAPFDPEPMAAATLFAAPIAELVADSESNPYVAWRMPETVAEIELTGFVVQRSTDGGGIWKTLDEAVSAATRTYTVARPIHGQIDLIRVAARSPAGVGAFSDPVPVTNESPIPVSILLSGTTVVENLTYSYGMPIGTFSMVGGQPGDVFTFEIMNQAAATVLAKKYVLDRYVFEVYRDIDTTWIVDDGQLEALRDSLNQQEFPRDLLDVISDVPGVLKSMVYGMEGGLLLSSHVIVEGVFEVAGNELRVVPGSQSYGSGTFDRESISGYEIGIRATNQHGLAIDQRFVIDVINVNEPPEHIALSSDSIAENKPAGSVVGNLSTVDPDRNETFTYHLVSGEGSVDNGLFIVDGSTLKAATSFDFEGRSSYSIRIRSTDSGGLWTEENLTVRITDVEVPPGVVLSGDSVAENQPIGTIVGSFSTNMASSDISFTFALVDGDGSTDNASFEVVGAELLTKNVFDYEVKRSYSIRVRGISETGAEFERAIAISVVNLGEGEPDLPAGLLAHYQLDGDAEDSSGNGRKGVAENLAPAKDRFGIDGGASVFDGISSVVTVPHDTALNAFPLSVSVWFQTTVGGTGGLVGKYWAGNWNGYQLPMNPDGSITPWYVMGRGQDVIGRYDQDGDNNPPFRTTTVNDGLWHNLVFTVDESGGAVFVDGVLQATKAWRRAPIAVSNSVPLTIGQYLGQENGFFAGVIDDVRLYDRLLSPAEIGLLAEREIEAGPGERLLIEESATGFGRFVVRGGGQVVLAAANAHTGGTEVAAGELVIRNPAALGSGPLVIRPGASAMIDLDGGEASLSSLDLEGTAVLDLGTSTIRIAAGGYDLATIRSRIASARAGGGWSGLGITSNAIAGVAFREIGHRVMADGSLRLGYSAVGDANMDGLVNIQDLIELNTAGKFGATQNQAGWWEGDYNGDGQFNVLDLIAASASGLYGRGSYRAAPVQIAPAAADPSPTLPSSTLHLQPANLLAWAALAAEPAESTPAKRKPNWQIFAFS